MPNIELFNFLVFQQQAHNSSNFMIVLIPEIKDF